MKFKIWLKDNLSSIVKLSVLVISFIMPIMILVLIWTNYNSTQHQLSELIDILKNTEETKTNLDSIFNLNGEFGFNIFISLIDITIAVWLGLNIYNALKKDNFDDLEQTIKDKCSEHEKLQIDIGESEKKIERVYKHHRALHNSYLLKAFDVNSNSAHYFYEMLQKINSNNMSYQFILYATYLETVYTKITTLHNQNEHCKMKPYILEGIKKYNALKDILAQMDLNNDVKKLWSYISYKRARLHFYGALQVYYTKKDYDVYIDIITELKKAIKMFELSTFYNKEIKDNINIDNTIGFIYIKIYELISNREQTTYSKKDLDEYAQLALKHCTESAQNHLPTVNSIKNLGIAYERNGRLSKAIKNYKEATKIDPLDYSSRICLASAYLKKLKKKIGFTYGRENLLCEMNIIPEESDFELLNKAKMELDIAYIIDSKALNYYYKMGELYTCHYLIEKNEIYKEKAIHYFEISKNLNDGFVAHRFHERNLYEAIGEIKQASALNDNLNGREKEHLKKLYEDYLTEIG